MVCIGTADIIKCSGLFSGQDHAVATSSTPDLAGIKILAPDGSIIQLMPLFIFFRKFPDFFLYLAEQLFIYNPFVGILCIDPLTLRSVSLLISLENALLIFSIYGIPGTMNILKHTFYFIIIPRFGLWGWLFPGSIIFPLQSWGQDAISVEFFAISL